MLDIATSLWFNKSYDLKKDFVANCEEHFHTTARNVDEIEDINKYVSLLKEVWGLLVLIPT